jgi:predicted AAA+ superfamily ATPase
MLGKAGSFMGNKIYTIGREFGSGGREIGEKLAERLGIKLYDKELLQQAAKESGFCEEIFENHDEKPTSSFLYSLVMDTYSLNGYHSAPFLDMPLNHKVFLAQFDTIKKIAERESCVIVGRIAKLRMRPMSLFESGNSSGDISLKDICEGRIEPKISGEVDLRKLIDFIIRGGWPANQETTLKQAAYLPIQYIQAVLDDDVYRIDNVKRDKHKMELLLRSLARNEATTVTNKKLKNDIKEIDDEDIDVETVSAYLDVFQRLFLTDNQKPFEAKLRSSIRIKQAEKRHLSDPSLAAALLNATPEMLLNDLNTLGFLFEALCERDLKIYAESFDAELYHYQDYNNNEMDAVIAMPDGKWCGFEIKLGANQIDMAAENLIKIKNEIKANGGIAPDSLCVICGLSNAAYQRPDGVFVVPITALRN